jgi:hypothetical protein
MATWYANLNLAMEVIELGFKIQIVSHMFGVLITLFKNHLYGVMQSRKKGKANML